MSKLKDSAILTLNDFTRIRENSKPLPSVYTSVNTLPNHPFSPQNLAYDETRYKKALNHKNKIIEYDNKTNDPYSKVSRHDDALQAMEKMCLYAKVFT